MWWYDLRVTMAICIIVKIYLWLDLGIDPAQSLVSLSNGSLVIGMGWSGAYKPIWLTFPANWQTWHDWLNYVIADSNPEKLSNNVLISFSYPQMTREHMLMGQHRYLSMDNQKAVQSDRSCDSQHQCHLVSTNTWVFSIDFYWGKRIF